MRKNILLVALVIISFAASPAKAVNLDSLRSLLHQPSLHDTTRLKLLVALSREYAFSKPDSCLKFSAQGIALSEILKLTQSKGALLFYQGNAYLVKSKYHEALDVYDRSLIIARNGSDKKLEAEILSRMGIVHWYLGEFKLALEKLNTALTLREELRDEKGIASVYSNIAIVYDRQGNYPLALSYQFKGLEIKEELGDSSGIAVSYVNIGLINQYQKNHQQSIDFFRKAKKMAGKNWDVGYFANLYTNLGQSFFYINQLDSALYYQQMSLKIREELGNNVGIAACNHRLALIYIKQNNLSDALKRCRYALELQRTIGDKPGVATSLCTMAEIYSLMNDYGQATTLAMKALSLSDSLKTLQTKRDALEKLIFAYQKQNDFKNAFTFQRELQTVRDSLLSEERAKLQANMEATYENEKKEKEIEMLHQQSRIQGLELAQQTFFKNAVVGGLVFSLLLLAVVYNRFRIKNRSAKILEEKNAVIQEKEHHLEKSLQAKELLLKEIHHRVKNNLQIISSLLNLQSRSLTDERMIDVMKEGQSRVKSMALIHQKLYQNEDIASIGFREYTEELVSYLFKTYDQQSRVVRYNISAADIKLDVDTAIPLGLIINELVSNSLKYAFDGRKEGLIDISLTSGSDDDLQLKVHDNGIGVPKDFDVDKKSSIGLRLVRSLSKQLQGDYSIASTNGFHFSLHFKVKEPALA